MMLPALARLACLLTVLFGAAFSVFRMQPRQDNAGFDDCSMPCWEGVQPGSTGRSDALALLNARGWALRAQCNPAVYELCYDLMRGSDDPVAFVYIGSDQVREIALFSPGMSIGDVWLAFGSPDKAAISPRTYQANYLNTAFWFSSTQISTRLRFPCPAGFADILRFPLDTILVWEPGTSMDGATFGSTSDLRRAIRQVCSV